MVSALKPVYVGRGCHKDIREVWVNWRIRKGILVVAVVIATRTTGTIPFIS